MKIKISFLMVAVMSVLVLPAMAMADNTSFLGGGTGGGLGAYVGNVMIFIQSYVIPFILGIGFLAFVWGMFQYFIRGGANDEAKENGRSLIFYAIAGFVVILGFWGIINLLSDSLGLEKNASDIKDPTIVPVKGAN